MSAETVEIAMAESAFETLRHEGDPAAPTILFAAGRGGDPARHSATLDRLASAGLSYVAPHFGMLASTRLTADELLLRVRMLRAAVDESSTSGPIVGVGHSIGATILLAMAGAQIWLAPGQRLSIPAEPRISRIAMLAPPVGFFRAPGALDGLALPIFLRSGGCDTITPPQTHDHFAQQLSERLAMDFAIVPEAGHFSFMDVLPPGQDDPMPESAAFRARLVDEIASFAAA